MHLDHIEPVSKGGSDDPGNLTTACSACNQGKSDMPTKIITQEQAKHPLIGWAFLSFEFIEQDGEARWRVIRQGTIRDVVPSITGELVVVDLFEWGFGEYSNSCLLPITELANSEFSKTEGQCFYKLFQTEKERNGYYSSHYGRH